jgi:hypothetical protein
MNDIAQTNLKEPEKTDWDSAYSGSKYTPPPPALGQDGKPIVYYGKVSEAKLIDPDDGYLNYQIDLNLTNGADGRVRAWVSARPFQRRNKETGELEPMKGNPNKLGSFLRAAGLQNKPQSNAEYIASVKAVNGRPIPFTIDWEAKDRTSGETVRGYLSFPIDPSTGNRKSVLKKGDVVNEVDNQGNVIGTRTVTSEVLFANPRLKYFQDSSRTGRA